ncbi:unannotated protein [freshwater metagenome]|uniref:Unannotated protein n=1 Tax=freshwater metagenome TaxID=449393 RepID=A0A6J6D5M2_9ZZZZ
MSARIVSAKAKSPPAPTPCNARYAASSTMLVANPAVIEPTTKIEIAIINILRLPKMSPSLP